MNIMKTVRLSLFLALFTGAASAQFVTPNTTLCSALTSTTTSVCLTATSGTSPAWSIVNQTGIYVDNEFMLVTLSNSQVISGTNVYVPVSRGNRSGPGSPAAHNNGAIAWIAVTPSINNGIYGDNGFVYGTQYGDAGACSRSSVAFLPHIWVDKAVKRDCIANASTSTGNWVEYNENGDPFLHGVVQYLSASGALSVTSGDYVITKTSVAALTLAAPVATIQDGTVIRIASGTAYAHTITATGLLLTGSASVNAVTFAAYAGASVTLQAYNGKWLVIASNGATFS